MPTSVDEQVRLLRRVDIFGPLDEKVMRDTAKQAPDTYLDEGEILYTPEDATEKLFILKKGRVQVYEITDQGEELTLTVVEDGNIFGEMTLTGQSLKGVYVRALVPSYICSIKRELLESVILKHPEVGLKLIRVLADRLYHSESNREDLMTKEVPARLATLILTLADTEGLVSGQSYKISTRYTQEQLASMIGCKRVTVTRAFGKLKDEGIVELRDRRIHIIDMDGLKKSAEQAH
jgi:CRP/FNR family transcriptional regulator, cyclic AMP receptor protein